MGVIEIATYVLRPSVAPAAFRAADERAQTEFFYQQPGLLRRTTAAPLDGDEWVSVTAWQSEDAARAAAAAAVHDEAARALSELIERPLVQRYVTSD